MGRLVAFAVSFREGNQPKKQVWLYTQCADDLAKNDEPILQYPAKQSWLPTRTLKLTASKSPWKETGPQKDMNHLPTIDFQWKSMDMSYVTYVYFLGEG